MKVEIRSHFWPATPDVREIKLVVDEVVLYSSFMNPDKIWDLARQFRHLDQKLMDIGNELEYEIIEKCR